MKEEFKIERIGEKFKITQHSEDVRDAKFIMQVYEDITRKREMTQQQLDNLPKQIEVMERDIEILNLRLKQIRPFLTDLRVLIKKDELKQQRVKK